MSNEQYAAAEEDDLDGDYRAAEWSYDPTAYDLLEQAAAYYPATPAGDADANGNGAHLRENGQVDSAAGAWIDAQGSAAAKMAPKPNLRMAGRRPEEGPKDTESKILAVSAQLQQLLEQRKVEASLGGFGVSGALAKRTGFKPAGAPQVGSRLPVAPPISLPMRAHRPPKDSGWPGLGRPVAHWKRPVLYTLLAGALVAGSFLAGRSSDLSKPSGTGNRAPSTPVLPPVESTAWSDADLKILDQALAADRNGDLNGALQMITGVQAKAKTATGLNGYIASLNSRLNDAADAEGFLAGKGELSTAQGMEQMGYVFSRSRDFDKAIDWLERSIVSNPFPSETFYRLGEALRRKGNFAEAVTRFDEALLRVPVEPEYAEQREKVAFKLRLAEIEGGRRADILPELEAQAKTPAPSGYWALTAAAVALQDGDMQTSKSWLTKAKTALGADQFDAALDDYFFRAFADRPEVLAFFAPAESIRKRKEVSRTTAFVDP